MTNNKSIDANLNDFAIRCFRDTADQDYITARMAYRAMLIPQFHWSSLQAIEKYFKAILLLNRIPAKDIGHNLGKALKYIQKLPFEVKISEIGIKFIKHMDMFGRFRYLEGSYFTIGPQLIFLDKTIWEIRRYCQVLDYELSLKNGEKKNMIATEIERIERSENEAYHKFRLLNGTIEKILDKKEHPARAPLIWHNAFFASSSRKKVLRLEHFQAINAPLTHHPEIIDEVTKYVKLPADVIRAYRAEPKKANQ